MPHSYEFAVHPIGGGSERLGGLGLADDAEAIAFGKKVIRDLMRSDAKQYAGWTMTITKSKRIVASIPFEPDPA